MGCGLNASVDAKVAKKERKGRKEKARRLSLRSSLCSFAFFASTLVFKDRTPGRPCNKALS